MLGFVTTDSSDRPDVGDYALARIEQTCLGLLVFFIAEVRIPRNRLPIPANSLGSIG